MKIKPQYKVIYSKETLDFLASITEEAKEKIAFNVDKVTHGVKDNEIFKKLDGTDDLWEFRTLYNRIKYRLLAFWDTDERALIITTHGFIKKTQKTPKKEIERAEEIKKKYYEKKLADSKAKKG
ncbi:MAG: type II toxin-antitoxin system RelE/ParE family toxin [Bacteroidales bacterium]|nr:type II toxin-antitoxin system RelE/ParE family toxin [Bacteroidales bacterium]